jgi:ABC-type transport system involved in cytochrome bd biosynthesis fused ATPase/permease subunit
MLLIINILTKSLFQMSLEKVNKKIQSLSELFNQNRTFGFYEELNFGRENERLNNIQSQLNAVKFRIAVIGEFSSGKSTFINAILGQKLLPATFKPTTNQVMSIEHHQQKKVMITGFEEKALDLNEDNIIELASHTKNDLKITTSIPPPMDNFIIYGYTGSQRSIFIE